MMNTFKIQAKVHLVNGLARKQPLSVCVRITRHQKTKAQSKHCINANVEELLRIDGMQMRTENTKRCAFGELSSKNGTLQEKEKQSQCMQRLFIVSASLDLQISFNWFFAKHFFQLFLSRGIVRWKSGLFWNNFEFFNRECVVSNAFVHCCFDGNKRRETNKSTKTWTGIERNKTKWKWRTQTIRQIDRERERVK